MLPNHAPLVVAEQFGTLEALHPGRIDLGIGRAPGTDQITALALRRSVDALSAEDFPRELARLIGYFETGTGTPRVVAVPGRGDEPAIWLLGSSDFSARLAGMLGLPFSFAHHFSSANTDLALDLYRREFRPSRWLDEPYAMVAVSAVCAETDERAEWLGRPGRPGVPAAAAGPAGPAADAGGGRRSTRTPRWSATSSCGRRDGQALGSPETVTGPAQRAAGPDRRGRVDAHAPWCTTSTTGSGPTS